MVFWVFSCEMAAPAIESREPPPLVPRTDSTGAQVGSVEFMMRWTPNVSFSTTTPTSNVEFGSSFTALPTSFDQVHLFVAAQLPASLTIQTFFCL